MDASPPLIVPSQRTNALATTCMRCGRVNVEPGNIWNTCRSCMAGPSATEKQHPIVNCTACRVPLRVPSQCQASRILCPPCQSLHVAIAKQNSRERAPPRTNPYPVVHPARPVRTNPYPVVPPATKPPCALALTLAFTYPNLPAPPPTTAPTAGRTSTSSNYRENVLRVCMRPGCGARLPPHMIGDVCEVCASAWFVRPPTTVQKRVPKRAPHRMCPRPRESPDVVCASLLHQSAHDSKVATEKRDVENDPEAELIYPDDTLVAIQHYFTTGSKEKVSKPSEYEDVELELTYPEDSENAASTSSSRPRARSPPPTTLRELFKGGLQTIPALQNPAAIADETSSQRCRMPGCNEALPAQTCMQRCIKCSISEWKRRKMAAKNILDRSQPVNTTSPKAGTSVEEKEATDMLDGISDAEDGSEPPPPPPLSSPGKGSGSELIGSMHGWGSDLTKHSLSDSDAETVADSDPEPDSRLASPRGAITGFRIRIPLLATRLPPGSPFRKCGNKRCNIALPEDHQWKTCESCRRAQRIKFEKKRRHMMGAEGLKSLDVSCRRWRSLSPEIREGDVTLTLEASRPCAVRHCRNRVPLPEVYQWKRCIGCRTRARRDARRKRDALLEAQHAACQPEIVPRFPAYQNRGALLSSFDAQLKGFVEGQMMYCRAKLHDSEGEAQVENKAWKPELTPMILIFVGEYSIVTGQRGSHVRDQSKWPDKPVALDAMRQEVSSIVLDLEHILRAKFRAGEAFAIDKGGIIMRFTCSLELIAQLRPLATTVDPDPDPNSAPTLPSAPDSEANASRDVDAQPAVPFVKTFSGELEAVVVPDESHWLFHGRRMVVRYRMVG